MMVCVLILRLMSCLKNFSVICSLLKFSYVFAHETKCNEHIDISMTCLDLLLPATSTICMTRAAAQVNVNPSLYT